MVDAISLQGESPAPGLESFVPEFFRARRADFADIRLYLAERDFESLLKLAHKWRGFCEPYGFARLGDLAGELEEQGKQRNLAGCEKIAEQMDSYLCWKQEKLSLLSQ